MTTQLAASTTEARGVNSVVLSYRLVCVARRLGETVWLFQHSHPVAATAGVAAAADAEGDQSLVQTAGRTAFLCLLFAGLGSGHGVVTAKLLGMSEAEPSPPAHGQRSDASEATPAAALAPDVDATTATLPHSTRVADMVHTAMQRFVDAFAAAPAIAGMGDGCGTGCSASTSGVAYAYAPAATHRGVAHEFAVALAGQVARQGDRGWSLGGGGVSGAARHAKRVVQAALCYADRYLQLLFRFQVLQSVSRLADVDAGAAVATSAVLRAAATWCAAVGASLRVACPPRRWTRATLRNQYLALSLSPVHNARLQLVHAIVAVSPRDWQDQTEAVAAERASVSAPGDAAAVPTDADIAPSMPSAGLFDHALMEEAFRRVGGYRALALLRGEAAALLQASGRVVRAPLCVAAVMPRR